LDLERLLYTASAMAQMEKFRSEDARDWQRASLHAALVAEF
jgi:hypothetical protein